MTQLDRVDNIHQRISQVRARLDALHSSVDDKAADVSNSGSLAASDWRRHILPSQQAANIRSEAERRGIQHDSHMDLLQRHLRSMKDQQQQQQQQQPSPTKGPGSIERAGSAYSAGDWSMARDALSASMPRADGRSVSGGGNDQQQQQLPQGVFRAAPEPGPQPPHVLSFFEVRPKGPTESIEPMPVSHAPPAQQPPPEQTGTSAQASFSQMQALLRAKLAEFSAERIQQQQAAQENMGTRASIMRHGRQASSDSSGNPSEQHTYAPQINSNNVPATLSSSSRFAPSAVPTYEPVVSFVAAPPDPSSAQYADSNRSASGDTGTEPQRPLSAGRRASGGKRLAEPTTGVASNEGGSMRQPSPAAGGPRRGSAAADAEPRTSLVAHLVGSFSDPKGPTSQTQRVPGLSREHFLSTPMMKEHAKRQPEIVRDSPRMSSVNNNSNSAPGSRPTSPRTGSNTADPQVRKEFAGRKQQVPASHAPTLVNNSGGGVGGTGPAVGGGTSDTHLVALSGAELFAILRLRGVISSHGQTGEHLLPLACCHSMFLTTEEYSQLLQLRELLKTQARASPKNASERRRLSPSGGGGPVNASNSTLSLRATEAALTVAEQKRNLRGSR
jgi:hypothetical protein